MKPPKELDHQLWMVAHIITEPIDASDYKSYIFPVFFFKQINDVYDEEYQEAVELYGDEELAGAAEQHHIQIPNGCSWRDVLSATNDVGKALQGTFHCVEKATTRLYGIFGDAPWTNKDRLLDSLIIELLNHYQKIAIGLKSAMMMRWDRAHSALTRLV